jgi:hypothetical protein
LVLGENRERFPKKSKIRIQLGLDLVDKGVKTFVSDLSYIIKFANMKRLLKRDELKKVVMDSINRIIKPAENHVFVLYAGRPLNGQRHTWYQPLRDPQLSVFEVLQ